MELTKDRLIDVLNYDEKTGVFTWKKKTSNRVRIGDVAGCVTKSGYSYISIDGFRVFAHRLAFLYMTGKFPLLIVDHIDRDKSNNKWENLREASLFLNSKNNYRNETEGHVHGVSFDTFSNKWRGQIWANGRYFSRRFSKKIDAVLWRKSKENELHLCQ